ncbi:MAG: hypothetical protein QW265_03975 [Candidatus Bathyarchaeia archaeon]
MVVPSSGVDPTLFYKHCQVYGGTDEEWRRYLRIIMARTFIQPKDWPNVIILKGEDSNEDLYEFIKICDELRAETGQPSLMILGIDTLITLYGERQCEKILNLGITYTRRFGLSSIAIVKAGLRNLAVRLSPIADVYLRLTREHGCLLLYGIKPRTCFYGVEMDVSKGYPLPKLTPIV